MPTLQEARAAVDQAVAAADGLAEWTHIFEAMTGHQLDPEQAEQVADRRMHDAGWYRTRHGWRNA